MRQDVTEMRMGIFALKKGKKKDKKKKDAIIIFTLRGRSVVTRWKNLLVLSLCLCRTRLLYRTKERCLLGFRC